MLAASLIAAGSDTVASEVGKAWGRLTVLVTTLRPVRPGTKPSPTLITRLSEVRLMFRFALATSKPLYTWRR